MDLRFTQDEIAFRDDVRGFMKEKLPAAMRGGWAPNSEAMIGPLVSAVRAGDLVLVKGSLGTRMAPLVEALRGMDAASQTRPKAANGH